jgi:hypothetical protein
MRVLHLFILLSLLIAAPAAACYGPKLHLGSSGTVQDEALFALVTLYLKEKTGINTVPVKLAGRTPAQVLAANKVDLVFAESGAEGTVVLEIPELPMLLAGPRPRQDLQFTTVLPALRRLAKVLTAADVAELVARIEGGASPMAAARSLLMARRWI